MNDASKPSNELDKLIESNNEIQLPLSNEQWILTKEIVDQLKNDGLINQSDKYIESFIKQKEFERVKREFLAEWEIKEIIVAKEEWLISITTSTHGTYKYAINDLIKRGFIPTNDERGNAITLGHFNYWPHEKILDDIKKLDKVDNEDRDLEIEAKRQVRAAAYISFTKWLNRKTYGWFRKAIPNTQKNESTFFNRYDKCRTEALSLEQWYKFIDKLAEINKRDALIAKAIFQGAKRVSEVISVKLNQIDWEKNLIKFKQSKNGKTTKYIPVNYPQYFMQELREYIDTTAANRKNDLVFITRTGAGITRLRLNYSFAKASEKCRFTDPVSPHVLRTTWVTYAKQQGVQDTEIMKVTGHSSSRMVYSYDKTSAEDNYTKKLILI